MQSKTSSLIEQILNVGCGFLISLLVWTFAIVPGWDLDVTMTSNLTITLIFTAVSIVRGYFWRRYFNQRLIKAMQNLD